LIVSGLLCCVAWRPLGEPHPEASYLALGIVLFIVAGLQVFFNAWQVILKVTILKLGLEQ